MTRDDEIFDAQYNSSSRSGPNAFRSIEILITVVVYVTERVVDCVTGRIHI